MPKENYKLMVNGVEIPVKIEITVEDDNDSPIEDHYDTSCDYWPATKAALESGEMFLAVIAVKASTLDDRYEGVASLGACELKPNSLFDSGSYNNSVEECIDVNGMIENALEELKAEIDAEKKHADAALLAINACNLGAVVHGFDRWIVYAQWWSNQPEINLGTDWLTNHPITTLYVQALNNMNQGATNDAQWGEAYQWVLEKTKEKK